MEKNNKFLVYYNNGNIETMDKINTTLMHMVEIGVIKFIFDCNDNKAYVPTGEGAFKEVKITNVSGL